MKEQVTVDEVIEVLNRMLAADPVATTKLMSSRVECNIKLAEDDAIQVFGEIDTTEDVWSFKVGPLGLLNGLFGVDDDGWGAIAMDVTKVDGRVVITEFRRVTLKDKPKKEAE